MTPRSSLSRIQQPKRSYRVLIIAVVIVLTLLIVSFALIAVTIYRKADRLMRVEPDPFATVSGNIMPPYSPLTFFSLDQNTQLSGWYFNSQVQKKRGNILFVHNNRANRVQFGLDTANLFTSLTQNGFNVLAFDLRHSGKSSGELSTYGYTEHEDVLAAMQMLKRLSGMDEMILYGVGSGSIASLYAWQHLPEKIQPEEKRPAKYRSLTLTRSSVKAFIFDTPATSADDFIRADLTVETTFDKLFSLRYVPAAIKLSTGTQEESNLVPLCTQIQAPMLITCNRPDTHLYAGSIDSLIDERVRLNPDTTYVFETKQAGHIEGFSQDPTAYLENIHLFLDQWFEKPK